MQKYIEVETYLHKKFMYFLTSYFIPKYYASKITIRNSSCKCRLTTLKKKCKAFQ